MSIVRIVHLDDHSMLARFVRLLQEPAHQSQISCAREKVDVHERKSIVACLSFVGFVWNIFHYRARCCRTD